MKQAKRRPMVFFIGPFNEKNGIYDLTVKPAAAAVGASCFRVDGTFTNQILDKIENYVRDADVIVADLTGQNPNVLYEFGYAYSLNKRVILLARSVEDIPFDLRQHHVVIYEGNTYALRALIQLLRNALSEGGTAKEASPPADVGATRSGAIDDSRSAGRSAGTLADDTLRRVVGDREALGATARESAASRTSKTTGRVTRYKTAGRKSPARDRVFISYSHDDKKWLSLIVTMSKPLVWSDNVHLWSDAEIAPGEKWEAEIAEALDAAKVAVLLVSPQFFASDFIMKKELPYILKAAEGKKLTLLWVAVTTSFVDKTKLAAYEAAHDPARPLDTLTAPKRSQALREICEQIGRALGLE